MQQIVNTDLIKNYIIENNLSKRKFCRICKIGNSTLEKIFNGEDFNLISLDRIAKVLNVYLCDFFKDK